jgi:hypothetical protein
MTKKAQTLNDIAEGVADVVLELMEDTVDWQLEDFEQDGEDYDAIHSKVMMLAIKKMYESKANYKTYTSINR